MRDASAARPSTRKNRRTIAIKPVQTLEAEINVTPLIDVVLVLLIVFMVLTPVAEEGLSVQLASSKRAQAPAQVAPEQVLVNLGADGSLQINGIGVARMDFVARLRDRLRGRSPDTQVVFVVAAESALYPQLVDTIDAVKQAGATTVGLALDGEP